MTDYISQLEEMVKAGKADEAIQLIDELPGRLPAEKEDALRILALAPDKTAYELLAFMGKNSIKDMELHSRVIQLVIDRAHLNYNFAVILLEAASEHTISSAVPLLRHILVNATDKVLLNRVIRSSGKLGIEKLTGDIAEFIFYDDTLLKAEAIKALERMGSKKALEKLLQASKTEKCDQDILDAIDFLSSARSEKLKADQTPAPEEPKPEMDLGRLSAPGLPERFTALKAMSQNGAAIAAALSRSLDSNDPDLILNLLLLVSRSIPGEAVNDLFAIINQKEVDNHIKFAAYNALEAFPGLKSAAAMMQGASEPSMFVRLAAIRALDKNLSDFVFAELRKKIEAGTKKAETLAQTILDARARHLIEQLMASDTFSYMASNHLAGAAALPVLDTFIKILEKRKLRSTAKKYKALKAEKEAASSDKVIVISPWESTLNVYSRLLHTCGFSGLLFQSSQEAFETIVAVQPKAIICDIFLTDMTGPELAREVRELYSAEQVPVILSSLQKNLDENLLKEEMDRSGATVLCDFPPKTTQIRSWMK